MATDGQPAQPFAAREGRLVLGPGNRIDAFVDCNLKPGASAPIVVDSTDGPVTIATIVCEAGEAARPTMRDEPQPLPANGLPDRMDFRGAFRLDATIGRQAGNDTHATFSVKRGRTVMLGLSNPTSETRPIHLHGHSFRLLDALDDGWKPFWLDTIPVAPRGNVRIAFVADNPGKWLLQGLDQGHGAAAWFEVSR
jgi:FtsP/CotA-like multicopper oxidase with cupredoxin domain